MKKNRKNVLSFFDYLKRIGIPFKVTIIHLDERFKINDSEPIHTDIDNLPMDIVDSDENYEILIYKRPNFITTINNNLPYHNRKSYLNKIETEITIKFPDHFTNYKRKTILDNILNDPNPPTQVPV